MGKVKQRLKEIEKLPVEQQVGLLMHMILDLENRLQIKENTFDFSSFYKKVADDGLWNKLRKFIIQDTKTNRPFVNERIAKEFGETFFNLE